MKKTFIYNLKQFLYILGASLATAVSVEVFLLPTNAIIGGVLGVSSILDILLTGLDASKWYLSAGIWIVAINIPIIIYCFFRFRTRFTVKTLVYLLLLAVELIVLRVLNVADMVKQVMNSGDTSDKVLYVVLGGALHGLSLPLLLAVNASTGGTDIVGLIIQRHSKKSSSLAMRFILVANATVIGISSLVYWAVSKSATDAVNMFIYSISALFICEIVQEAIFKGFSSAIELEVTTDKPVEMAEALSAGLKHGVTTIKVMGGYSHQEKTMVLCVINRSQLVKARRIINKVDPTAFAYVENVKEVIGKGFANKEIEMEDEENN
ncbi:MAG: YitT family protein [Clostridiales bacterium]|nr:YitT family protein [Clostridiales bacterium]